MQGPDSTQAIDLFSDSKIKKINFFPQFLNLDRNQPDSTDPDQYEEGTIIDPRIKNLTPKVLKLMQKRPFWINDNEEHRRNWIAYEGNCCYNHIIGLPVKKAMAMPLFDYETDILYEAFENYKLVWILKARGLGVTEFSLRYMTWKAIAGDKNHFKNAQIAIIVGPKLDIAKDLVQRIRDMFMNKLNIQFETRVEELILPGNNVLVRAYPSTHIDAFRGQPNVSTILVDEGDFFAKGQQKQVRDAIEPYNTKSGAQIILVSTPNRPDGLMQSVEKEENSSYHMIRLDYTYGLGKIYTQEEIDEAKRRGYFEREYNLKYEGLVGNAFHQADVDAAITNEYDPYAHHTTSPYYGRSMGIDQGFGSSQFGIVITQGRDNKVEVIYAETFDRPLHTDMIELIVRLKNRHHISQIFIDASNAGFVSSLKQRIGDIDYQNYVEDGRIVNHITDPLIRTNRMNITPVNFVGTHKDMLHHVDTMLNRRVVRIHPVFNKLITSLRTAQVLETWVLDKEATAFDDVLDAFRLSLLNYFFAKR